MANIAALGINSPPKHQGFMYSTIYHLMDVFSPFCFVATGRVNVAHAPLSVTMSTTMASTTVVKQTRTANWNDRRHLGNPGTRGGGVGFACWAG